MDYIYILHCCTTYEYTRMYLYIPAMQVCGCCCCCSVWCYTAVAAAAVLLLAAAVCHRVPDGNLLLWSIASDSRVVFPFIQTRFIFRVPLGSTEASIYLINTYHTSSVIAGMRGSKAGVSPPRRSSPCMPVWLRWHSNDIHTLSKTKLRRHVPGNTLFIHFMPFTLHFHPFSLK